MRITSRIVLVTLQANDIDRRKKLKEKMMKFTHNAGVIDNDNNNKNNFVVIGDDDGNNVARQVCSTYRMCSR